MNDPIERQDVIDVVSYSIELCNKALDSITLGRRDRYAVEVERNSLLKLKDDIKLLPSAQPEIIYCKKCKHWTETCGDKQWGLGDCDVFDKHLVMCDGYCAWAGRREE